MLSKIINGRRYVTADGQGISVTLEFDHLEYNHRAGEIVSNPRIELLIADGWEEWTPPTPEPQPQTEPTLEDRVAAFERLMNVGTQIVALDDEAALQVIALFPAWFEQLGKEVNVGERYYYNEQLWKVLQKHTVQDSWKPDLSPSLYVKVSIEEYPAWVQPVGSTDAYAMGAKVSHNDKHWTSLVDGNVWEPSEAVPALWQLVA